MLCVKYIKKKFNYNTNKCPVSRTDTLKLNTYYFNADIYNFILCFHNFKNSTKLQAPLVSVYMYIIFITDKSFEGVVIRVSSNPLPNIHLVTTYK